MSFSAGRVRGRVAVGARQSRHSLYPPEPWGAAGWTQGAKLLWQGLRPLPSPPSAGGRSSPCLPLHRRPRRLTRGIGSKRYEKLANLVVAFQRMPKRQLRVELIAVAPSIASTREIAVCDEFGHDALGGTFGNAHFSGDIAQPHPGIFGNAQQNVRVISEEGPVGHLLIIDDTRYAIHAIVSMYYSVFIKEGWRSQESPRRYPPVSAPFPLGSRNVPRDGTLYQTPNHQSMPKLTGISHGVEGCREGTRRHRVSIHSRDLSNERRIEYARRRHRERAAAQA